MSASNLATIVFLAAVVGALLWGVALYNRMVKRRNHVEDGWSGIDVQLKRRHNLIPNLVETVKRYASHEQSLLESVARLRTPSGAGEAGATGHDERELTRALHGLMVQVEAYPELKADENFQQLQQQLEEIESDIQYARRYYNGAVREYNTLLQSFPANLLARQFDFREAEFFELEDDTARETPKVDFS
ncbi:MAG: LemA family protein [Pseudomonadota bacterium]|nr:LemA family protein [Pseudomonadota bacterium]